MWKIWKYLSHKNSGKNRTGKCLLGNEFYNPLLECRDMIKMKLKILILICLVLLTSTSMNADSFNSGVKHHKNRNYEEAVKNYSEFIKTNPDNAFVEYNMGGAMFELKKYKEAINHYNKAIQIISNGKENDVQDDKLSKIYYNLSVASYYDNQPDKAVEYMEKSLKIDPHDENAKYNWYVMKNAIDSKQNKESSDKNPQDGRSKESEKKNKNNGKNKKSEENKNKQNDENKQNSTKNSGKDDKDNKDRNDKDKNEKNPNKDKLTKEEREKFLDEMKNREIAQRKYADVKNEKITNNTNIRHEKDW